jgi:hypothetical protein
MLLVGTGIHFFITSSGQVIKRYSISTKTERSALYTERCRCNSLFYAFIRLERINSNIDLLWPSTADACLALTITKPLNNIKFHIQSKNVMFLIRFH